MAKHSHWSSLTGTHHAIITQASGIYSAAGKVLLEALSPGSSARSVDFQQDSTNWRTRGLAVYRDYLSCGNSPPLRVLDRLLASLRLPFTTAPPAIVNHSPPRLVGDLLKCSRVLATCC